MLEEVRIIGSSDTKEIVRGEDRVWNVELLDKARKVAVDLTQCTSVVAELPNADGSKLSKTWAVRPPATDGVISGMTTALETALLKTGEDLAWQVAVTIAGVKTIVQLDGLAVRANYF
jgi:hypothetical protein